MYVRSSVISLNAELVMEGEIASEDQLPNYDWPPSNKQHTQCCESIERQNVCRRTCSAGPNKMADRLANTAKDGRHSSQFDPWKWCPTSPLETGSDLMTNNINFCLLHGPEAESRTNDSSTSMTDTLYIDIQMVLFADRQNGLQHAPEWNTRIWP